MSKTYIPCLDRPANVFSLSVYKPQGRPAYAVAQEGRVTNHGGGIQGFEMQLFGDDRSHRVLLNGNNTAKNRASALALLLSEIENMGWVDKGHSVNFD